MKKMILATVLFVLIILCATVSIDAEICHYELAGDIDGNCKVDIVDFALMAQSWLIDCQITPDAPECIPLDIDGDGFDVVADCNDNDPNIYPGAIDYPNDGIDQDCDGSDAKDPDGTVWVYIEDPGVFGHEGFSGYMSKYETTNAQYCQYLNAALSSGDVTVNGDIVYGADGFHRGADFVGEIYCKTYPVDLDSQIIYSGGIFSVRSRDGYDMADHPVVEVSWYGATAFCNYYGYRLPTEWEWQAVADYDGNYTYGCGMSISHAKANYDRYNPLGLSRNPYTSPVGHYGDVGYGYGLCDMAGNAWEWTSTVSGSYRTLRGGSWSYAGAICTVSNKGNHLPSTTHYAIGFRVCR